MRKVTNSSGQERKILIFIKDTCDFKIEHGKGLLKRNEDGVLLNQKQRPLVIY